MRSYTGIFATGTGAATTTIAVTGVGFTPKALFFWWTGDVGGAGNTAANADAFPGFGAATGTSNRWAASGSIDHAVATTATDRYHSDAACIISTTVATGALDGSIDFQSFDASGFTLVVDDAFPTSRDIHYLALGGDDLTNAHAGSQDVSTSTGNQTMNGVGFQGDFVLFVTPIITANPAVGSADLSLCIGAATSSTAQWAVAGGSTDGAGATDSMGYNYGAECWGGGITTMVDRATFVGFAADGFTHNILESAGAARSLFYLVLKGGNYAVGDILTQADTVTTSAVAGLGWKPTAGLFASANRAESTQDTITNDLRLSVGAFANASATLRSAASVYDAWNADPTDVTVGQRNDAIYQNLADAANQGLMDVQSVDVGGFTLIMDDADPGQCFLGYIAFGPAGTTYTQAAAGVQTNTGALARKTKKPVAGSQTNTGAASRKTTKSFAGSQTNTGALARKTKKALAGAITLAGTLASYLGLHYQQAVGGAIAFVGTVSRKTKKALAGAISFSGALSTYHLGVIYARRLIAHFKDYFMSASRRDASLAAHPHSMVLAAIEKSNSLVAERHDYTLTANQFLRETVTTVG